MEREFMLDHARYLLNKDEKLEEIQKEFSDHVYRDIMRRSYNDKGYWNFSLAQKRETWLRSLNSCGCHFCRSLIWWTEVSTDIEYNPIYPKETNRIKKNLIRFVEKLVYRLESFHVDGIWGSFECHVIGGNELEEYNVQFYPNENCPSQLVHNRFCERDLLNFISLMDESTKIRAWVPPDDPNKK
jgi:hypothetical protein